MDNVIWCILLFSNTTTSPMNEEVNIHTNNIRVNPFILEKTEYIKEDVH